MTGLLCMERGGEGYAMALDLVTGWVFISIKSEATPSPLYCIRPCIV